MYYVKSEICESSESAGRCRKGDEEETVAEHVAPLMKRWMAPFRPPRDTRCVGHTISRGTVLLDWRTCAAVQLGAPIVRSTRTRDVSSLVTAFCLNMELSDPHKVQCDRMYRCRQLETNGLIDEQDNIVRSNHVISPKGTYKVTPPMACSSFTDIHTSNAIQRFSNTLFPEVHPCWARLVVDLRAAHLTQSCHSSFVGERVPC